MWGPFEVHLRSLFVFFVFCPYVGGKFEDIQHLIVLLFEVQGFSSNLQGIIYLLYLYVTCGNDKKKVQKKRRMYRKYQAIGVLHYKLSVCIFFIFCHSAAICRPSHYNFTCVYHFLAFFSIGHFERPPVFFKENNWNPVKSEGTY